MNRFVTSTDLAGLVEKAASLGKLAEAAQAISADLNADKSDTKDVHEAVKRCQRQIRKRGLAKKQREKIEQKLEFYDEWLHHSAKSRRY